MPIFVLGDLVPSNAKIADSDPLNSLKKLVEDVDNFCHLGGQILSFWRRNFVWIFSHNQPLLSQFNKYMRHKFCSEVTVIPEIFRKPSL
jgi:hypothetical protein